MEFDSVILNRGHSPEEDFMHHHHADDMDEDYPMMSNITSHSALPL